MINRSTLNNWNNGNMSELSRTELILLVSYFEKREEFNDEDINEDMEEGYY